jgi:hypothetical protein
MDGDPTTGFNRVRAFAAYSFGSNCSLVLSLNDVATSFSFHLSWRQHKMLHLVQFILHFLYVHDRPHVSAPRPQVLRLQYATFFQLCLS